MKAKLSETGEEIPGQSAHITIAASEPPRLASAKTAGTPLQSQSQPQLPSLPAPIPFAYDDASFANVGNKQAAALSEFLRQRKPEVRHADGSRG